MDPSFLSIATNAYSEGENAPIKIFLICTIFRILSMLIFYLKACSKCICNCGLFFGDQSIKTFGVSFVGNLIVTLEYNCLTFLKNTPLLKLKTIKRWAYTN